jgi:hypothetical protein
MVKEITINKCESFLEDFKLYIALTKCKKYNNNKIVGLNNVNNGLSSAVRFYYIVDLVYDKRLLL